MRITRLVVAIVTVALATAFLAAPAEATPAKCKGAITKASAQYAQARTKALVKCQGAVVAGKLPLATDCKNELKTDAAIDKAKAKMEDAIDKACGGADKDCGSGNDDDPLASIGWLASTCPDIESLGCSNPIEDCHDVNECLECVTSEAVDQAIELYYDDLVLPSDTNKTLNKCQQAIGKASAQFLAAKSKALAKCWAGAAKGSYPGPCPLPGDGKAVGAIENAEAKKIAAICKACGGGDKGCDQNIIAPGGVTVAGTGGSDDITPGAIGFPANCATLAIPGDLSCAQTITTLADIVECVDCITEFKVDCIDRLAVPWGAAYPGQCNPGCGNNVTETPEECDGNDDTACPGGCAPPSVPEACTCNTGTFSISTAVGTDLDTGWTGISHDQSTPVGRLFTGNTYDCSGAGPDTLCRFIATYATPFFGPPLPLSTGGVPVCVVNEVLGTTNGTLDLVTGDLVYDYSLISRVHNGISPDQPCPVCVGDVTVDDAVRDGTCNGGPNAGGNCDADAVSTSFGAVSFDCPPNPAGNVGNIKITFDDATTGTKTVTTSAASPPCSALPTEKCFCDTCNNENAEACASNADCPPSGGDPGICGGRRCLGGPNLGAPCTSASVCPSSSCARTGEPTKPSACIDDTSTAPDETICAPIGGNQGNCAAGPVDNNCAPPEQFRGCTTATQAVDCPITGNCLTTNRKCFLPTVVRTGTPGIPNGAYAGNFCIAPTTSASVNAVAGLPGLGTLVLPYTISVNVP